jgi:alkylated DNA repair dioxygenase AlkB
LFDDGAIHGPGLEIEVHRNVLSVHAASDAFATLMKEVNWRQDHISMFGKKAPLPRLTAWFGDPGFAYTYSGIEMMPKPWTPTLEFLKNMCEKAALHRFNSALANLYRTGSDGVAWHSDNEPELGRTPVIASLSLGGTRKFQLRRLDNTLIKREIVLFSGDLIIMSGTTQQLWVHQVPKTKAHVEPRINLTFREIIQ